jgi:CPA1 family monovalent cation:H+ antiporter
MFLFELVLGLLFAGGLFVLWAERLGIPYPALLALVGALVALVPGAPEIRLDPELALALFVAPTLLDAAFDASPRDLQRNLVSVASLAVALVLLTVAAVAIAVRVVAPEVGWAPAIALGAIVAPPDASAATAVLRKLRPPHRLLVILEGESLFNDATALLVYRVAVGAAITGTVAGWSVVPMLLISCVGGVFAGWLLARLEIWAALRIDDIPTNIVFQFVGTFAVWLIAEHLGLSAIITMVAYAMTVARRVGGRMNAWRRIASYAVWDVAVLVLNVLAFVLIGLQLRGLVSRVHGAEWSRFGLAAAAVCGAVIVSRAVWVALHAGASRLRGRRSDDADGSSRGTSVVAAWCGMRGIVTLATALALPESGPAFPHRDLIVFCAFCVVLFTLVVQGGTLRPLMQRLGMHDDGVVEREIGIARSETARAALAALEAPGVESRSAEVLRTEYRARLRLAETTGGARPENELGLVALQRRTVSAQRDALTDLRARRVIGDDAFHAVEEEIDLLELTADPRVRPTFGEAS